MEREKVIEEVRKAVQEVCRGRDDVIAAYLYGSFAREEEGEGSDVDIALLFDRYDIHRLLELSRKIDDRLDIGREIDVRALNRSGVEFPFNVITEAKLLYESDAEERADLEQKIESRYHDMRPYIQDYRREMRRRLAS